MKSKVTHTESKELEYPCLKIADDLVVLFSREECGTTVNNTLSYGLAGSYCTNWAEENFKPFEGTVTLSN